MKETVKISIIMSVYNPTDKKQFYKAVQSVIRQSFPDWELLLYDDGSAAPYAERIRKAAVMDGRIRYIRGERNRGLAYGLNQCIRQASGEFVARMDADDISRGERLARQYAFLKANPFYAWVGSNAELMDDNGIWGCQRMPARPGKKDFLFNSPYIHPTVMFRRKILVENGGYCTAENALQCEDYELFMRLHANGFRGCNLQDPLLSYREDYASVKKRTYARRIREMKIRREGFERLGILNRRTYWYVIKPLLIGMVPHPVHHYIRRVRKGGKIS